MAEMSLSQGSRSSPLEHTSDRLPSPASATDGLQSIIQHVAHFSLCSRTGSEPNVVPSTHNQQDQPVIIQLFGNDTDERLRCRIRRLLLQLIQTAQALRQDHSRIESGAL